MEQIKYSYSYIDMDLLRSLRDPLLHLDLNLDLDLYLDLDLDLDL